MPDCTMELKPGPGKRTYVRCTGECPKDETNKNKKCVFYLVLGKEGNVKEAGCECAEIDLPGGEAQDGCTLEWAEKNEKGLRKFYYRCKKEHCSKECVFWFEQNERGELEKRGCECKAW